ncbi:MAG: SUMF1/EgtB/PvdO family nonheme iron enzyme [Armatimonadetes bacterium]|nr:SUMF1/EgtB/PvdO family nonheme iron enzyme [Armatimonadota bacterium]
MPIVTPDFNPGWSKKDHPIVIVSWKDAKAYCDWAYLDLPTEAEWEYACRGGLAFKEYPWGNEFDRSKLRCSEIFAGDSGGTSAVGAYPANGYGLHDMMGNVMQWCSDFYSAYAPKETDNPQGPTSGKRQRVVRGGSWHGYHQVGFRCAYRYKANPTDIATLFGFRCVYRGHR